MFISSTYADRIEVRKKVLDILLMADCIPAGMEAFVATDAEQFEVIKKVRSCPSAVEYTTENERVKFDGILEGKERTNDIRQSCKPEVQVWESQILG